MREIPFIDVSYENKLIKNKICDFMSGFIDSGNYIMGNFLQTLEKRVAEFCNVKYAIGVNSGTDALVLSLKALNVGPGDEVITTGYSFIATYAAIAWLRAIPVIVDVDKRYNIDADKIREAITSKTKAILPVDFTGRIANMKKILEISNAYGIPVVEDAAQAFGAQYNGKKAGTYGDLGCFSFFPTKVFSTLGDGGMILTNNKNLYNQLMLMRDFGRISREEVGVIGINSRLDELQAAILNMKMSNFEDTLYKRQSIAKKYSLGLQQYFDIPINDPDEIQSYHLYMITLKKKGINNLILQKKLRERGIDVRIHYPVPAYKQETYKKICRVSEELKNCEHLSKYSITLPLYLSLSDYQLDYIITSINSLLEEDIK